MLLAPAAAMTGQDAVHLGTGDQARVALASASWLGTFTAIRCTNVSTICIAPDTDREMAMANRRGCTNRPNACPEDRGRYDQDHGFQYRVSQVN